MKRFFAFLLCAAMLLSVVPALAATEYDVTEPITIEWWHAHESQFDEQIKYMVDKFNAENGMGITMKICHNALVSQIQNGVNETSTLAAANGIDMLTYAQAISYGGAGNWYLDSKKAALAAEDYTTAFSVQNEHKDVHICLDLAAQCGVKMPGEENAARVYDKALEMGLGGEDFCATIKVVRGE